MRLALADWRSGKNGEMRASEDVSGPSRGDWEGRVEGGGAWPFISLVAQVVTQKALSQFRMAMSVQMLMLSWLGMR